MAKSRWKQSETALDEAVAAIREMKKAVRSRNLDRDVKVDVVTKGLHSVRRSLDDCCIALEWNELDQRHVLDPALAPGRAA